MWTVSIGKKTPVVDRGPGGRTDGCAVGQTAARSDRRSDRQGAGRSDRGRRDWIESRLRKAVSKGLLYFFEMWSLALTFILFFTVTYQNVLHKVCSCLCAALKVLVCFKRPKERIRKTHGS